MGNKFVSIKPRLMTPDEAGELAVKLNLNNSTVEYIKKTFSDMNDLIQDGMVNSSDVVGTKGKISTGVDWEHSWADLYKAMYNVDDVWPEESVPHYDICDQIWSKFFQE